MASDMRAIERWWKKQRKATPVGAAPRIDALLDGAARELGLHSAFDWDLAADVFRDYANVEEGGRSAYDDHRVCVALAEACQARAKVAADAGDLGDE